MVDCPLLCESLPEVNPIKSHSTTINKLTKPPFSYGFPIENGDLPIENDDFPIENDDCPWFSVC